MSSSGGPQGNARVVRGDAKSNGNAAKSKKQMHRKALTVALEIHSLLVNGVVDSVTTEMFVLLEMYGATNVADVDILVPYVRLLEVSR